MKTTMLLLISTVLTLFTFCYSSDSSDEIKKLYYNAESYYRSAKDDPAKYDLAIDDYEKAFEKSKNGSEDINKKLAHIGFKVKLGIIIALKKLALTHLRLCFHSNITT